MNFFSYPEFIFRVCGQLIDLTGQVFCRLDLGTFRPLLIGRLLELDLESNSQTIFEQIHIGKARWLFIIKYLQNDQAYMCSLIKKIDEIRTRYSLIGAPPSLSGAFHLSVTLVASNPPISRLVGASGGPPMSTSRSSSSLGLMFQALKKVITRVRPRLQHLKRLV